MMSRGADVLCLFFVLRRLAADIPTPAQSPFFELRRLVDGISYKSAFFSCVCADFFVPLHQNLKNNRALVAEKIR